MLAQVEEALQGIEERNRTLDERAAELQQEAARQKTAREELDTGSLACPRGIQSLAGSCLQSLWQQVPRACYENSSSIFHDRELRSMFTRCQHSWIGHSTQHTLEATPVSNRNC